MTGVILTREVALSVMFRIKLELDLEEDLDPEERADTMTGVVLFVAMVLQCSGEVLLEDLDKMVIEFNDRGRGH